MVSVTESPAGTGTVPARLAEKPVGMVSMETSSGARPIFWIVYVWIVSVPSTGMPSTVVPKSERPNPEVSSTRS